MRRLATTPGTTPKSMTPKRGSVCTTPKHDSVGATPKAMTPKRSSVFPSIFFGGGEGGELRQPNSTFEDLSVRRQSRNMSATVPFDMIIMEANSAKWGRLDAPFRKRWTFLQFLLLTYNSFATPIALWVMDEQAIPLIIVDIFVDAAFVVDTFLRFQFEYIDSASMDAIAEKKRIRHHYLRSMEFKVGFLSAVSILMSAISIAIPFFAYFDILRLLRLYLFKDVIMFMKALLVRNQGTVNESLFRMGLIVFATLQAVVIGGCFYFYIACPSKRSCSQNTWVGADDLTQDSLISRFLRACHFVTQTLFTIGYGDSVAPVAGGEIVFTCIFILTGLFLYSLILANMTSVLSNFDVVRMRFRNEIENIKSYLALRAVPAEQQREVKRYFEYCYAQQGGMLERHILARLPRQLMAEVAFGYQQHLENIPFFRPDLRPPAFLQAVAAAMEMRMHPPGSLLARARSYLKEIMVVTSGRVEMLGPDTGNSLYSLVPGDYFGDYQVLFGGPLECDALATELVDALCLHRRDLHRVLNLPRFAGIRTMGDAGVAATFKAQEELVARLNKLRARGRNSKLMQGLGNSGGMLRQGSDGRWGKGQRANRRVLFPDSPFHLPWDAACVAACAYLAVVTPLRAVVYHEAIAADRFFFPGEMALDYLVDLFFLVDAALNATVVAVPDLNSAASIVTAREEIGRRYRRSFRFKMDVLSLAPVDVLAAAVGYPCYLRLSKAFRLVLLPVYLSNLAQHLSIRRGLEVSGAALSVANMLLATLMVTHWTSCFWSLVHSQGRDLLQAWYWTFTTFTTVGYGDISPASLAGTAFFLLVGSVGVVFWAGVIGNITCFVQSIEISDTNVGHRRKATLRFLSKQRGLLGEAGCAAHQARCAAYFAHLEAHHGGLDEEGFLRARLPPHLVRQIRWSIAQDLMGNCPMFQGMGEDTLAALAQGLERQIHPAGSLVLGRTPPALGMYFIKWGLAVALEHGAGPGQQKQVLPEGAYFFRAAVLEAWEENPYKIQARTDCELFLLRRATFNAVLSEQPDARRNMQLKKSLLLQRQAEDQEEAKAVGGGGGGGGGSPRPPTSPPGPFGADPRKLSCATPDLAGLANVPGGRRRRRCAGGLPLLAPGDHQAHAWNAVVVVFTLLNWVMVPYRIAFCAGCALGDRSSAGMLALAYLGDLVYALDVPFWALLQSYQEPDGEVQTSRRAIARRYVRSWRCAVHLAALLPLEALAPAARPGHWSRVQVLALLRLNRLVRVADFTELVPKLQAWLVRLGVHNNTLRVVKLLTAVCLASHVFGCVFFLLAWSRLEWAGDCDTWAGGKGLLAACNRLHSNCTLGSPLYDADGGFGDLSSAFAAGEDPCAVPVRTQYVWSMYWAMATLTTVGYGDVSAASGSEIVFGIFAIIAGTLIFTLAVAYLTDIITQMDVTQTLFKNQVDRFNLYCKLLRVPPPLAGEVERYARQLWLEYRGVPPPRLQAYLPPNLRRGLAGDLAHTHLEKLYFLKDHPHMVPLVAGILTLELCMSGQKIFVRGEPADRLFLLVTGSVALVNPDNGTNYTTLERCVVGEAEFFARAVQPCDARVQAQAQVFLLEFEAFWQLLNDVDQAGVFYQYVRQNVRRLEEMSTVKFIEKLLGNLKKGKLQKMMTTAPEEADTGLVFEPKSKFVRLWNCAALAIVMYYIYTIPLKIAFPYDPAVWEVVIDQLLDMFFYADIYMNLRHFAIEKEGLLIKDREQFGARYRKKGMVKDVLSCLPVALVGFAAGLGKRAPGLFGLCRIPQLVRTGRMVRYGTVVFKWVQQLAGVTLRAKVARINRVFVTILVMTHYVACLYLFVGRLEHGAGRTNWLEENGALPEDVGASRSYLASFYWALYTLTTVGYGAISVVTDLEKVFSMACMVLGSIVFDAGMVAILSSIIEDTDHEAGTYQRQLKCTQKYMAKARFDDSLAEVVLKFFEYTKTHETCVIEGEVLGDLSFCLRREVFRFVAFDHLRRAAAFSGLNDGLLTSLVGQMAPYTALPGEVLLDSAAQGVGGEELYVLQEGDCRMGRSDQAGRLHRLPRGSLIAAVREIRVDGKGLRGARRRLRLAGAAGLPAYNPELCERAVEVTFLGGRHRTRPRPPTERVTWDEELEILVSTQDVLQASIYDSLKADGRQSLLGKASIPVAAAIEAGEGATFPLLSRMGEKCGEIRVHLETEGKEENGPITTIACRTFCHLYQLKLEDIVRTVEYVQNADRPVHERMPARKTAFEFQPVLKLPKEYEREAAQFQFTILEEDDYHAEMSVINRLSEAVAGVARRLSLNPRRGSQRRGGHDHDAAAAAARRASSQASARRRDRGSASVVAQHRRSRREASLRGMAGKAAARAAASANGGGASPPLGSPGPSPPGTPRRGSKSSFRSLSLVSRYSSCLSGTHKVDLQSQSNASDTDGPNERESVDSRLESSKSPPKGGNASRQMGKQGSLDELLQARFAANGQHGQRFFAGGGGRKSQRGRTETMETMGTLESRSSGAGDIPEDFMPFLAQELPLAATSQPLGGTVGRQHLAPVRINVQGSGRMSRNTTASTLDGPSEEEEDMLLTRSDIRVSSDNGSGKVLAAIDVNNAQARIMLSASETPLNFQGTQSQEKAHVGAHFNSQAGSTHGSENDNNNNSSLSTREGQTTHAGKNHQDKLSPKNVVDPNGRDHGHSTKKVASLGKARGPRFESDLSTIAPSEIGGEGAISPVSISYPQLVAGDAESTSPPESDAGSTSPLLLAPISRPSIGRQLLEPLNNQISVANNSKDLHGDSPLLSRGGVPNANRFRAETESTVGLIDHLSRSNSPEEDNQKDSRSALLPSGAQDGVDTPPTPSTACTEEEGTFLAEGGDGDAAEGAWVQKL